MKATPLCSSARRGSEMTARFSMNPPSLLERPKKECSSVRFLGVGKLEIVSILVLSGFMPSGLMEKPAKSMFVPISSFSWQL